MSHQLVNPRGSALGALNVPCDTQINTGEGTCLVVVRDVWIYMSLNILAKFPCAVFVPVKPASHNYFSWRYSVRDACLSWHGIEEHNYVVDKVDDKLLG